MHQRVSLVTGAARGLGLAVARELAAGGDRVHLVWRTSSDRASQLEPEFAGRLHRADLLESAAAHAVVGQVLEAEGRLDRVVHAVGDFESGRLDQLEPETLRRLFESNVMSAWNLVAAGRQAIRASGGAWLFFGCAGLGGGRARTQAAGYAATKSALALLVRSMAKEEAPHGVRVNMLSPGIVPHDGAHADTLNPARQAAIPMGRTGRPEEIARAAAWLLSEDSGYATGQDLEVAGGWLL
ncbi:SDR family NAD(P)-dependent oxidoreductase [Engelhardtia mirabilis]|uniref:NADP-dependent 7-alpha-hydroxysteroid dehydrogenase n=1 Tax=Engelhardtia mirabilis TaxID=2528011 RepID=A0A518BKU7_9BACT|nr:NADP-dependent 7-alpha-hydroxysteroid dehydrogenase [Planctomycetes bacterium Pla133]QDV01927.1 NADP-dependent 7-alpha-hydroxysteroid dehydrogenase [Planctomycetes bacterium Pla86]